MPIARRAQRDICSRSTCECMKYIEVTLGAKLPTYTLRSNNRSSHAIMFVFIVFLISTTAASLACSEETYLTGPELFPPNGPASANQIKASENNAQSRLLMDGNTNTIWPIRSSASLPVEFVFVTFFAFFCFSLTFLNSLRVHFSNGPVDLFSHIKLLFTPGSSSVSIGYSVFINYDSRPVNSYGTHDWTMVAETSACLAPGQDEVDVPFNLFSPDTIFSAVYNVCFLLDIPSPDPCLAFDPHFSDFRSVVDFSELYFRVCASPSSTSTPTPSTSSTATSTSTPTPSTSTITPTPSMSSTATATSTP